jgi:multicomponent Na+:H+ antiporter subunit D
VSAAATIVVALLLPLAGAVGIGLAGSRPNVRETVTLVTAVALAATVWSLSPEVMAGGRPGVVVAELFDGITLAFTVEPLGMLFAALASTLWIINSVYSIGYMRGNNEKHQTRFYVCFAIALSAAIGVAFADNLLTLFLCYEVLTLSTYPLVSHKGDEKTIRSARVYLGILLGTSIGLLLPAIIWTYSVAGTLTFTAGGILAGKLAGPAVGLLLGLYVFGIYLVGYSIATFVFLVAAMLQLGVRKLHVVFGVSIGWVLLSYWCFVRLMHVSLPSGVLLES